MLDFRNILKKVRPSLITSVFPDIKGMLEEREYRKLAKLGRKHKIPVPEVWLRRQVFLDGEQILDRRQRSHSYVRSFYNLLFGLFTLSNLDDNTFGAGLASVKDTGGVVRFSVSSIASTQRSAGGSLVSGDTIGAGVLANAGDDTHGILIGTDNTAESFEDFFLIAQIDDGVGGGEMSHVQSGPHSRAWNGGTKTFSDVVARFFNNNSGGGITVEEVVLVTYGAIAATTRKMMLSRDLTGGDVVADTAQYKVTYETSLVYP